jgi:cytochrome o ubiquinol oxidase subunit I
MSFSRAISPETAWDILITVARSSCSTGASIVPVEPSAYSSCYAATDVLRPKIDLRNADTVIIPGVIFGVFAGYVYWFPKAFGFTLDERWGRRAFWCWFIGFHVAFMPIYVVGLMGMTRRLQHYDVVSWQPWLVVAAAGVAVILAGIFCQIVQLVVSIRAREELRDVTGDPWNGRTLEWSTASPPPAWNFAVLPRVTERDAFWAQRARAKKGQLPQARKYAAIEVPKNTPTGFVNAFFAVVTGFALIWHIWWMAALGVFGAFVTFLAFAFREQEEVEIPADTIAQFDRAHPTEVAL